MRTIRITPVGNVGNQMFQYLFAHKLQLEAEPAIVTGYDMPMWGLARTQAEPLPEDTPVFQEAHVLRREAMLAHLRAGPANAIVYSGYGQRLEYYGPPNAMATYFPQITTRDPCIFGADYLVINVRGAEIHGGIHPDYMPVPLWFYEQLVSQTGLKPVFHGQIGTDVYSNELRHRFPSAIFLAHRGAANDWITLNGSADVVISVSTFAFLGAWLSPVAQLIHMPLLGFFNQRQRPDIDLCPVVDERFRFHEFPVRKWRGTEDDLRYVLEHPKGAMTLTKPTLSLCAIMKNEGSYVYEWLSYHYAIGVERFFIFDNGSTDDMVETIRSWPNADAVTIVDWPHQAGQVSAYREMITKFRDASEWCAFIDGDEFLRPTGDKSIPDILRNLPDDCGALYVHWLFFGSSGFQVKQPGLVTETFLKRAHNGFSPNRIGKTIARLSAAYGVLNVHMIACHGRTLNDAGDEMISSEAQEKPSHQQLAVNHYFCKSLEEWRDRRSRGRATKNPDDPEFRRSETLFAAHDINHVLDEAAANVMHRARERFFACKLKPVFNPDELTLLSTLLHCSNRYMEFGSGGSTVLACQAVGREVTSVDSSSDWQVKVAGECRRLATRITPTMTHVDIGGTGEWGYPTDRTRKADWPAYYRDPCPKDVDLVLVDGRFRVACFITAALRYPAGTVIMIHDFQRAEYQCVRIVGREIARAGSLSAFVRHDRVDMAECLALYRTHELDPR
jgi:hypothetical protein